MESRAVPRGALFRRSSPLALLALAACAACAAAEPGGDAHVDVSPSVPSAGAAGGAGPAAAGVHEADEPEPRIFAPSEAAPNGRIEWPGADGELSVRVGRDPDPALPSVIGTLRRETDRLVFEPRFPLELGLDYTAVHTVGAQSERCVLRLDDRGRTPTTEVVAVYPSATELPANLLKFYVHFSAPMRRGEAYAHVELLGADGSPRPDVLLELTPELWDPDGRRLTLLFDPGRIKSGLQPRRERGPTLEVGQSYRLRIDAQWRDAHGLALARGFTKDFEAVAYDETRPGPERWHVTPPVAGTRGALVVDLDEPLDHALLERLVRVRAPGGEYLAGAAQVSAGETRWSWTPREPWASGTHDLVVADVLEDRAGNSIGRAFEVDLRARDTDERVGPPAVIPFEVAAGR